MPGRLVLAAADRGVKLRVTAKRTSADPVIFLRYAFSNPRDFRFRVDLPGGLSVAKARHDAVGGVTSLVETPAGPLSVATLPVGGHVAVPDAPNAIIRDVKGASEG